MARSSFAFCEIRRSISVFESQLHFPIQQRLDLYRSTALAKSRSIKMPPLLANHGQCYESEFHAKSFGSSNLCGYRSKFRSVGLSTLAGEKDSRSGCRFRYGTYNINDFPSLFISRTLFISVAHFSQTNKESRTCWKCGGDTHPNRELFFCKCGVVQEPAEELTFFDLLQLEQSFDIDLKRLAQLYRDTQSRLHPDKFSTKSQQEQIFAEEQSALLNKAYDTLQKPLSRANYLLQLSNNSIDEKDSHSDPNFLMDIMAFNEKLSTDSSPDDIDKLNELNEKKVYECVKCISECFCNNDLESARNFTIKLRYYTNIQERIKTLKIGKLD